MVTGTPVTKAGAGISSFMCSFICLRLICLFGLFLTSTGRRVLPELSIVPQAGFSNETNGDSDDTNEDFLGLLRDIFNGFKVSARAADPSNVLFSVTRSIGNDRQTQRRLGGKVDVPVPSSPDEHLVTDLPLLDHSRFSTEHWAGLLPASDDGHKYLFYWLFAPPNADPLDTDTPLLIWLNGGPACSSMDGLWLENGPFRLVRRSTDSNSQDWTIDIAPHSWHNAPAYVVYIDQPVGTGISFTTNGNYPTNDEEVNVDFYYFLQVFLKLHADKFVDETITVKRPVYFSGESHAGHYIPSMMHYIHQQNTIQAMSKITVPLSGGAIGNGWFDPVHQYSAHQAAYGFGMIGLSQLRWLEELEKQCQKDLARGIYVSGTCFGLLNKVVDNSAGKGSPYRVSQYDQRKWEHASGSREFPPGHKDVESFLGAAPGNNNLSQFTQDVLAAIHSTPSWTAGQRYLECTDPPYNALKHQDGLGVTDDVTALLNANIRLLFFNGIHDLICNHVGNEIALENLRWDHQHDYITSKRYGWASRATGTSKLAGYMKEYPPLSFLKVLDSGHMVPMDVPGISLDMMKTFMYRKDFDSYEQELDTKAQGNSNDACPVCPEVSKDSPSGKECLACKACPEPASENYSIDSDAIPNTVEVPLAWIGIVSLGIFGMSLVGVCVGCYCCFCKPKKSKASLRVPQYDLELPRNGGYVDNFDDDVNISEGGLS